MLKFISYHFYWIEPDLRATFKLAITHGLNYTALSNTEGTTVNM